MRHVRSWICFFVVLWWLWLLLAGEWNHYEWIAATAAAAAAATLGEIARTRARATPGRPATVLASAPSALAMVFVDFAIILRALAMRAEGVFLTNETSVAGSEAERAWGTYLATLSANAYVIEVDPKTKVAVTHHLIPLKKSQEPV